MSPETLAYLLLFKNISSQDRAGGRASGAHAQGPQFPGATNFFPYLVVSSSVELQNLSCQISCGHADRSRARCSRSRRHFGQVS